MPYDLDSIVQQFLTSSDKKLPPVHSWKPELNLDIDIRIDSEGKWYHEGAVFERGDLMRLFASILVMNEGQYFLVTPREKFSITVDDVPFVIVAIKEEGDKLFLVTQCEDVVELDSKTFWQLRRYQGVDVPYVCVRDNLFARLERNVFYQLVELALEQQNNEPDETMLHITVNGRRFELGSLDDND